MDITIAIEFYNYLLKRNIMLTKLEKLWEEHNKDLCKIEKDINT